MTNNELKAILQTEINHRLKAGYAIKKRQDFEVFLTKKSGLFDKSGWLIIVKPDGKIGAYPVTDNPFKDPNGPLAKLRIKYPITEG